MSRRTSHFRKLMRQKGVDSPRQFFPTSKARDSRNQTITEPMDPDKADRLEQRIQKLGSPHRR